MKTRPSTIRQLRVFKQAPILVAWSLVLLLALAVPLTALAQVAKAGVKTIPVIFDTDIGDDIDDTWALGLLLRSPEFDVKLVVGDQGKTLYRARLIGKFLETVGRADIPIGLGIEANAHGEGPQADWVKGYNLNAYPGKIYPDGVQAIIDVIRQSPEPVTLLAIGPLPNIAAALERQPIIAERVRFVGMHGSVRLGYDGGKTVAAEYNVKADIKACQKSFTADWPITLTPLDTCGLVFLEGERYQQVRQANDVIARAIIENYRIWSAAQKRPPSAAEERSSILFDTVAVYLAHTQDLLKMERLGIRVNDQGLTVVDPQAKTMEVATEWKNLDGFRDYLVNRLVKTGKD